MPATKAMTQTGADAEQASLEWIERLRRDADGDDVKFLELLKEHLDVGDRHMTRVRDERAQTIVRLRATGVSNMALKEPTGLSDSGVARAALGAGAEPRVNRRSGPNDRRTGPSDRRSSGAP